jgi:hypothetical protein
MLKYSVSSSSMYILWLNLKSVELILNTKGIISDKPYWEKERKLILKELLKWQLENYDRR